MALEDINSPSFNLMEFLNFGLKDLIWGYVWGKWQVQDANPRWQVVPEQRLLYRAYNLSMDSCLGIAAEIEKQPRSNATKDMALKHKGKKMISLLSKYSRHDSQPFIASHSVTPSTPRSTTTRSFSPMASRTSNPIIQSQMQSGMTAIATPAEGQSKECDLRWPHKFFVVDIINGLKKLKSLTIGSQSQPAAFQAIFHVHCICETLCQKKKLLQRVHDENQELLDRFVVKGCVHAARWAYFESAATGSQVHGKKCLVMLEDLEPYSLSSDDDRYAINSLYSIQEAQSMMTMLEMLLSKSNACQMKVVSRGPMVSKDHLE